ncbi:hemolysin XhlA family protein [Klebsiella pneumoniae]|uniref:hemolysin XhlA family protein n=1 Tax=Klebsiella pneumoniae TaxID=573 RepID=UPI002095B3CF|nr:hemolysin XhlA family protein [Klebsiella pneumoniae]USU86757.1 hemolysin XhlA family protein [Klebsiella pneumoniae]HBQ7137044.1 hypothetical protein [Klebsiella pneumoniae]HBQ7462853.1 hypothetical protein [Klebsiella pneumoniae]HBT2008335.1 hypothetical protein [Klebsiella pneumoniae]HCI4291873.1 hypothetical protein [Klebsiella pneumoniae]
MNNKINGIVAVGEKQESPTPGEPAELGDIGADIKSMENRIVDKMDENQKWLVGLLVSAILVPLFIALVTK